MTDLALTYGIPASWYLTFTAALFCLGLFAVMIRRSAIGMLIGVEMMLNAASLNFAVMGGYVKEPVVTGQVFSIFIITLAAAEAAIGLALIINVYRVFGHSDVDKLTSLKN